MLIDRSTPVAKVAARSGSLAGTCPALALPLPRRIAAPPDTAYAKHMRTGFEETLAARISRILADRIVAGEIGPGEWLRQDYIAEEFGASHVPVREAFRRLEAQGLVTSEPRKGVRVTAFDLPQVKEVAEMRAALEELALRHAAPHLTPAILQAAEEAIRAGDISDDVRSWEKANRHFHQLILTPCAMPRLLAAIDDLHAASARFLFAAWQSNWEQQTDHDHRVILAALSKGEIDRACATLARHVRRIGRRGLPSPKGQQRDAFIIVG